MHGQLTYCAVRSTVQSIWAIPEPNETNTDTEGLLVPQQEMRRFDEAQRELTAAKRALEGLTNRFLCIVLRIMRTIHPERAEEIREYERDVVLGPRYAEIVARAMTACGITAPDGTFAGIFEHTKAIELAAALNEKGVEITFVTCYNYMVAQGMVRGYLQIDFKELKPWTMLGEAFSEMVNDIKSQVTGAPPIPAGITADSTFSELMQWLNIPSTRTVS
jgi:hypothetical protein